MAGGKKKKCLRFFSANKKKQDRMDWHEASSLCQENGASLVEVTDKETSGALRDVAKGHWSWIGMVKKERIPVKFSQPGGQKRWFLASTSFDLNTTKGIGMP